VCHGSNAQIFALAENGLFAKLAAQLRNAPAVRSLVRHPNVSMKVMKRMKNFQSALFSNFQIHFERFWTWVNG